MTKLVIDASFNIGRARDLANPEGYETKVSSVGRKGAGEVAFLVQEVIAVTVILDQVGLVEWARSKAYDVLWEYLKDFVRRASDDFMPPRATVVVNGQDGTQRAIVEGLNVENMERAKVEVKEKITESPDGTTIKESTVRVDLRAKK